MLGMDTRLTALISRFLVPSPLHSTYFWWDYGLPPPFKSTAFNFRSCYFFLHYSFQIRRLSQQQHIPTAQKRIQPPKAHKILFKFSLITDCNPWDPARPCSFPGGLHLQIQVSQIAKALNQFSLWRPMRNPSFLLTPYLFQFHLPPT